jgi:prevent-host-death family protein
MRKITTGQARNTFSDVVNEAAFGQRRVLLTRHGKNIAAVVPISDVELLCELERLIDVEEARKALADAKEGGTTTLEQLKKELGL